MLTISLIRSLFQQFSDRLCNNNSRNRLCNSSDIIDTIMQRACRTSAGIDSYFKVQELFCVPGTFLFYLSFPLLLAHSLTHLPTHKEHFYLIALVKIRLQL